jgi:tight adherence protein B
MSTDARSESALVSPALVQIAVITLSALAFGGVVYVTVMPFLSGERKASKRVASVTQRQGKSRGVRVSAQPLQTRRKQVQDTIKDLEAKEKAKRRINLRTRLVRAGVSIAPRTYYIANVVCGVVGFLVVLLTGSSLIVSLLAAIGIGFGLPRFVLSRMTKKRQAKFIGEFANSIDIIVRGIKSGLPLADCLQIIATEAPEPIKSEFNDLVEQQRVGVPLSRAFDRMYERLPLQEVNFFAIVIAIQAQTGGNLAEALSNLSQVLRDRFRLQMKVRTFSAEAKASAMIIASLPIGVMSLLFFAAPDYISLLWTEKIGKILLMGCGIWMLLGVFVMKKMIAFDY